MNTLIISLIVLCSSVLVSFFYGLISKNYSTVDRLWSVLPAIYVLIWLPDYITNTRYLIAGGLIILWGIRLTTNFAIKGGYNFSIKNGFTVEDYRWEHMRNRIKSPLLFEIFNFFFISAFQLGLIFLFTLPLYYYGKVQGPISNLEVILFLLHLSFLLTETAADYLQFRFYRRRNISPWSGEKRYQLGFNTFGLWKYSRHPNYVCELGQWTIVYFYLYAVIGTFHWSGIGVLMLISVFAGSTALAESITASKYPGYKDWQNLVSVWIPFIKTSTKWKQRNIFLTDMRNLN